MSVSLAKTFTFGESDDEHTVADPRCGCAWWRDTLTVCDNDCPGLVHWNFVDESGDSLIFAFLCDLCGSTDGPD